LNNKALKVSHPFVFQVFLMMGMGTRVVIGVSVAEATEDEDWVLVTVEGAFIKGVFGAGVVEVRAALALSLLVDTWARALESTALALGLGVVAGLLEELFAMVTSWR
jgi:hypothetical protein